MTGECPNCGVDIDAQATELDQLRADNAHLKSRVEGYEKQWTEMDYTIGQLRQDNERLRGEVESLRTGKWGIRYANEITKLDADLHARDKALVEAREALEKVGFFCAGEGKFDYVTKHVEKTLATINSLLGDKCGDTAHLNGMETNAGPNHPNPPWQA